MSNEDKGDGPAFSEMMIRRHDGRAEIAAARRKADGARGSRGGGGGGRANAVNNKPQKGAAAVAAVADRCVRELVLNNLTSREYGAAPEALFPEAASEVAAAAADCGGELRRRMAAAAAEGRRNPIKVRPPRTLPRPLLPIFFRL